MKRVVILQHRLLHYRVSFFDRLREICLDHEIEIRLVHGHASAKDLSRGDEGSLPWADIVKNRYLTLGGRELVWQSLPSDLFGADLIVMMQENRMLSNYPLQIRRAVGQVRLAFWGHGRNFQSRKPNGLLERWKTFVLRHVDWWFSYTAASTELVTAAGFPRSRVTQLDNAIDNTSFQADLQFWTSEDISHERSRLGIDSEGPIAIYCGSLYPDKRLDILVSVGDILVRQHRGFALLILGDGPSMPQLLEQQTSRPWLHVLGARKGREKALYFRMSHLMLNPGAVGLHVVDAFCAGVVMITSRQALHGPEIAYLEDGVNGVLCDLSARDIAVSASRLICDPARMKTIASNAAHAGQRYTQDNMLSNFVTGLCQALKV